MKSWSMSVTVDSSDQGTSRWICVCFISLEAIILRTGAKCKDLTLLMRTTTPMPPLENNPSLLLAEAVATKIK